MPKLEVVNNNMYQKKNTGADFNRALGILKDSLVIVSAAQEISRIIPTAFKYLMGTHELEVYINGTYVRRNENIDGTTYGEYSEYTNFSVLFNPGVIIEGDLIRFRITTANYKIVNISGAGGIDPTAFAQLQADLLALQAQVTSISNNLQQVGRDSFGVSYLFSGLSGGSTRTIGEFADGDATPDISGYRIWKTHLAPAGPITITNLDGGKCEDIRTIIFTDNQTTIADNANIILAGNRNLLGIADEIITLIFDGAVWREIVGPEVVRKTTETIAVGDWIVSGSLYYHDITIPLSARFANVSCYHNTPPIPQQIMPYYIERPDYYTVRIWMPVNTVEVLVVITY